MAYRNAILDTLMLYKYDASIFYGFNVPDGLDRQNVIDTLLLETAGLSVIYTSPESLKQAITIWTKKNLEVWEELYKTLHYDYNPIHNYDRTEEGKDILDGKNVETRDLKNTDEYSRNLHDKSNAVNKIAAFNDGSGDMANANSSVNDIDYTGNSTDTKKDTGTVSNKTDDTNQHYLRAYGNIGVTTTQQMIEAQRDVVQFNLTDYIVTDYKKHFCVCVY